MSSRFQLWRFQHIAESRDDDGFDRHFVPLVAYNTGDIDIHDVNVDESGRPVFVNTLFNCLATTSDRKSFDPIWKPDFISNLTAQDRCHLNGLAMRDGKPGFVTVCGRSDVAEGWRDHQRNGGCVVDVPSGEIVSAGLSMPHSPRWYRDRLWLLNSGDGYFGYIDLQTGSFERVTFCPGYARGLSFSGDYAIVGLSLHQDGEQAFKGLAFKGLAIEDELSDRDAAPRCGVHVIDLRTGNIAHWLQIDGGPVKELHDVVVLPDVVRPKALGLETNASQEADAIQSNAVFQNSSETSGWSANRA